MESHSKKIIPWIVAIALFMETLDVTIISTAIPAIAESFGVDPLSIKLALTSYVLSLAIFIPISGWIADRLGTRTTFVSAILLFIASSLGCGLASSLPLLVLGRIVQGVGGALMMPTGSLVMLQSFNKNEFIQATTFMTTPALLGPMLGPLFGGWITTYSSWNWIFYINIPIGLIGLLASLRYIRNNKREKAPPFDLLGFILLSISMITLFTLIESINIAYFSLTTYLLLLLLSAGGLFLFSLHYKKTKTPVINFNLFTIKTFRISAIGNLASRLGISSVSFLLPLFFQIGYGLSPLHSGLLICIWTIGLIAMKFFQKKILQKFGFSKVLPTASFLTGTTMILFSYIDPTILYPTALLLFINGFFASIHFLGLNTLYYAKIEQKDRSNATSIVSTIQYLSAGIGITISALVLQTFIGWNKTLDAGFPTPFRYAFIATGAFVCLTSLLFLRLNKSDGIELLE